MSVLPAWSHALSTTLARDAPALHAGPAASAPELVAKTLAATVPGCDVAGVVFPVLRSDGRVDRPFRDAVTHPVLLGVLAAETSSRSGPIRAVHRSRRPVPVHLDDVLTDSRWPEFGRRVPELAPGLATLAVLPVEVVTRCVVVLGSFEAHGLDAVVPHLDAVVAPVELFLRLAWAETRARHLGEAVRAEQVVATATGMVMAADGVDAIAALTALRARAHDCGRSLRAVAEEVVTGAPVDRE